MSPNAIRLFNVLQGLLIKSRDHWPVTPGKDFERRPFLVEYGDAFARAELPRNLVRTPSALTDEIAEYCAAHNLPPLHALAVRADNRMPGTGYSRDGRGDGGLKTWGLDVKAVVWFWPGKVTV